MKHILINNIEI